MDNFAVGDKVWMQHHTTKKWYKTAVIIEIRHSGRAYLVKDDLGQSYVRGRRFLRLDDRKLPSHACRLIKFYELSPISSHLGYSQSDNALSDFDCSLTNSDHSSSNCDIDSFIMHSPSSDPSSPDYRPQSQFHHRSRRSYTVNPVPTLVCGVPVDIISVHHHFNHVPRGPLIPRPLPAHEGGADQPSDQQQAGGHRHRSTPHLRVIGRGSQHGDHLRNHGPSPQPGGRRAMVPMEMHQGVQQRLGRRAQLAENPQVRAVVLDAAGEARSGTPENSQTGGDVRAPGRQSADLP